MAAFCTAPAVFIVHERWEAGEDLCDYENRYFGASSQIVATFDNLAAANKFATKHVRDLIALTQMEAESADGSEGSTVTEDVGGETEIGGSEGQGGAKAHDGEHDGDGDEDDFKCLKYTEWGRKRLELCNEIFRSSDEPIPGPDGGLTFTVYWEGETIVKVEKFAVHKRAQDAPEIWPTGGLIDGPRLS
jgi:hypothetical protein